MLNLTTLPSSEAERIAYSEGFTMAARLFARIDDLERAAEALLDSLDADMTHEHTDLDIGLRETLDQGIK